MPPDVLGTSSTRCHATEADELKVDVTSDCGLALRADTKLASRLEPEPLVHQRCDQIAAVLERRGQRLR